MTVAEKDVALDTEEVCTLREWLSASDRASRYCERKRVTKVQTKRGK